MGNHSIHDKNPLDALSDVLLPKELMRYIISYCSLPGIRIFRRCCKYYMDVLKIKEYEDKFLQKIMTNNVFNFDEMTITPSNFHIYCPKFSYKTYLSYILNKETFDANIEKNRDACTILQRYGPKKCFASKELINGFTLFKYTLELLYYEYPIPKEYLVKSNSALIVNKYAPYYALKDYNLLRFYLSVSTDLTQCQILRQIYKTKNVEALNIFTENGTKLIYSNVCSLDRLLHLSRLFEFLKDPNFMRWVMSFTSNEKSFIASFFAVTSAYYFDTTMLDFLWNKEKWIDPCIFTTPKFCSPTIIKWGIQHRLLTSEIIKICIENCCLVRGRREILRLLLENNEKECIDAILEITQSKLCRECSKKLTV